MPGEALRERVDDAIIVDEVGIETGRYGPFYMKTLYQPIFQETIAGFVPWGVAGTVVPYRNGKPVSRQSFSGAVAAADGAFVEGLCRMLQLRNYRNIGVDGLMLHFSYDPDIVSDAPEPKAHADDLMRLLDEVEIDPWFLICEVASVAERHMAEIATALRLQQVRVAVDDFGSGNASVSLIRMLDPEIVKFSRGWFHRIVKAPTALRLLGSLVDALRREGRQVLIDGIETQAHLQAALATGAEFLQGNLLGVPRPVGSMFDMSPLDGVSSSGADGNVIDLLSRRNRPA